MTTVALVMIARDEAPRIGRALSSVAPWVDDMVVLDTGSGDGTPDIARSHGARVEHFNWCDDFAAAKNAALDLSGADMNLVLDADEWLLDGGHDLRSWCAQHAAATGLVSILDQYDVDGEVRATRLTLPRLLPRATRYRGRIHEQPTPLGECRDSGLVLGHDGYLPAAHERKRGRNEALLRRELSTRADDGYLWTHLGKDLEVQGRLEEAVVAYEKALAATAHTAAWRHEVVTRALYVFGTTGRFDRAREHFDAEVARWSHSPDLFFIMADVLMDLSLARPQQAAALAPLMAACWRRCLEIGERPDLAGAVAGRGSHLARRNLDTWESLSGRR